MGGKYDGVKYFDHHQDINLECSLFLVAKYLDISLYEIMKQNSEFEFLNVKDTKGIREALTNAEAYKEYSKMIEYLLLSVANSNTQENSYYLVGKSLYEYLQRKLEMKQKIDEMLSSLKTFVYDDNSICWSTGVIEMPSIVFNMMCCDLLVFRSQRSHEHVQIIKNTNKQDHSKIKLDLLKNKYQINFLHSSGFTCTIDYTNEITEDFIKEIVEVLF